MLKIVRILLVLSIPNKSLKIYRKISKQNLFKILKTLLIRTIIRITTITTNSPTKLNIKELHNIKILNNNNNTNNITINKTLINRTI
jgi:hypothetical protein